KQEMDAAAEHLRAGDTFLLTFSGHGTVVRRGAWGGADEAWCLADCVILDDTLYQLLTHFEPNVRVWVISDSCYSGTMVDRDGIDRDGAPRAGRPARAVRRGGAGGAPTPEASGIRPILWRARDPHARRAIERGATDEAPLEAAVLCLGACREDAQTTSTPPSKIGAPSFSFTQAAIDLWQNGNYDKTCWDYCNDLIVRWHPDPKDRPTPYWVGNGEKFGAQKPAFPNFFANDELAPVSVAS
ncbi:MAG TPA: caspase family protein, partial [Polyangiaceae bacterium]|nr:caspase family protein [Polyangiaceae bacterium]